MLDVWLPEEPWSLFEEGSRAEDRARAVAQLLTDTYHAAACSARDAMSYEESGVVTAVEVLTAGAYECPLCKRIGNRRLGPNDPRPPFHLGCRCTTVPIV